jgi:tRNA G18 (ribose-2'-O)-methylase SpoU
MARPIHISDIDDERLEDYRDLRDKDLRGARRLFTVESPRVLGRFLASGWPIESVLIEPEIAEKLEPQLVTLDQGVPVYVTPKGALRAISGYGFHGGALALGRRDGRTTGLHALADAIQKTESTILAAEGVVHVDNMGSLFRNAACLGADGVLLSPTCADPLLRKTVRISIGSVFTLDWTRCESERWLDTLEKLSHEHGFHLVALETGDGIAPIDRLQLAPRTMLLLGAEGTGLSPDTLRMCDQVLEIPMRADGGASSVNVAVASAIGLYELARRRRGQDLD